MGFLPYAFGSNFAVKRTPFEALGGFPEDWRTAEDVVFSWRLQLAGVPLQFVESAPIARRTTTGFRSVLAQHFAYGVSDPRMFQEFRDRGAVRPPGGSLPGVRRSRSPGAVAVRRPATHAMGGAARSTSRPHRRFVPRAHEYS